MCYFATSAKIFSGIMHKRLIPKGKLLDKKTRLRFIDAHGKHTASLFKEPKEDRSELFYPFFQTLIITHCQHDVSLFILQILWRRFYWSRKYTLQCQILNLFHVNFV